MNEINVPLFLIGLIGMFVSLALALVGKANDNSKMLLSALRLVLLSAILAFNQFWGAWYLFLKNAAVAVPTWAWIAAGVWIYLNAGWRFAEYKLRLEKRSWIIYPLWLHFIFPVRIATGTYLYDIVGTSLFWKMDGERSAIVYYKMGSMVFFGPALLWNAFMIIILWSIWLATLGRFMPIHQKTLVHYFQNQELKRKRELEEKKS